MVSLPLALHWKGGCLVFTAGLVRSFGMQFFVLGGTGDIGRKNPPEWLSSYTCICPESVTIWTFFL